MDVCTVKETSDGVIDSKVWTLYTDGASSKDDSVTKERVTYALRFNFECSNNKS